MPHLKHLPRLAKLLVPHSLQFQSPAPPLHLVKKASKQATHHTAAIKHAYMFMAEQEGWDAEYPITSLILWLTICESHEATIV